MGSQYGWFTDARHTVPVAVRVSAGQFALLPLQYSAGSQMPELARHTVPATAQDSTSEPLPELKFDVCVTADVPAPA